jgi:hypothetical protein
MNVNKFPDYIHDISSWIFRKHIKFNILNTELLIICNSNLSFHSLPFQWRVSPFRPIPLVFESSFLCSVYIIQKEISGSLTKYVFSLFLSVNPHYSNLIKTNWHSAVSIFSPKHSLFFTKKPMWSFEYLKEFLLVNILLKTL